MNRHERRAANSILRHSAHTPKALENKLDKIRQETLHEPSPETLCHFTTGSGLEGILGSKKIWATDFRGQKTDDMEFRHVDAPLVALLDRMASDSSLPHDQGQMLVSVAREYETKKITKLADAGLFLTSFCRSHENAKVWRDFGDEGRGYAIEFRLLENESLDQPTYGIRFLRVEYSEKKIAQRLEVAFQRILEAHREFMSNAAPARLQAGRGKAMQALWVTAAMFATFYKSADHEEDTEWRMIVLGKKDASPPVVDGPPRRLEVPLRRDNKDYPVVAAVHIGLNVPRGAERDIEQFLRSEGYSPVPPIVRSKIQPAPTT
jgi:Protein of unknown function (DUF2971)